MVQAIALDLGSSQIKVGNLTEAGHIELQGHEVAPQLKGRTPIRVANPQAYLKKATQLLSAASAPKETPLGISCQRSSFVLWHAKTGRTLTPMISWQDLRAQTWCQTHHYMAAEVKAISGLPLSPHYVAAKLAMVLEEKPELRKLARNGLLRFGTLDTYLIWNWTDTLHHHMDLSMAARTQLLDVHEKKWSSRLLELFDIPRSVLPDIPTQAFCYPTTINYPVCATVADQASCAIPVFSVEPNAAFINAGTATFIMRAIDKDPPPGLLSALLPAARHKPSHMIWEAPINAGSRVLRGFKLPTNKIKGHDDPNPDGFGIADAAGLGAPYWRPDLTSKLSESAAALNFEGRQRIYFESLIFRTREVLGILFPEGPEKVILAGGLSARFDFSQTLASALDVPLFLLKEKEMSLWGAAWMATGCKFEPKFFQKQVQRKFTDTYLLDKYTRWKEWMARVVSEPPEPKVE